MTWTRLFHIRNVEKAFKRVIPGAPREELAVSKRYQAEMAKLFRINGVPWLYDLKPEAFNPRDKKPKTKKRQITRPLRLAKIEKALKETEAKELQFRQERLNKRSLGGMDRLFAKSLPSWIKPEQSEIPEYMRKGKKEDGQGEE